MKMQLAIFLTGLVALCSAEMDLFSRMQLQNQMQFLVAKQRLINAMEKICPDQAEAVGNGAEEMRQCFKEQFSQDKTICSVINEDFMRCAEPTMKPLKQCKDGEMRPVIEFTLKALKNVFKFVCKQDGEHIFELANTCAMKPTQQLQRCMRLWTSKVEQYSSKPTVTNICDAFGSLTVCISSHIQASCKNEITRESFNGLINAVTDTCNSVNIAYSPDTN